LLDFDDPIDKEYEINREYELPIDPVLLIGGMESIKFRVADPEMSKFVEIKFMNGPGN
jgi:hypothetical protein